MFTNHFLRAATFDATSLTSSAAFPASVIATAAHPTIKPHAAPRSFCSLTKMYAAPFSSQSGPRWAIISTGSTFSAMTTSFAVPLSIVFVA